MKNLNVLILFACLGCIAAAPKDQNNSNNNLKIITREEWNAKPPRSEIKDLKSPVDKIILSHTATEECHTETECKARVHAIQKFYMGVDGFGFDDIPYNFLIGGDGIIYEGRGWNKEGHFSKGYNSNSIGIALVGTFVTEPSDLQLIELETLITEGVKLKKIRNDYQLDVHRQLIPQSSPGERLYERVKTLPRFVDDL